MPKRRKGQSTDFVAGAYKRIALNKEGLNAQQLKEMRLAADRLALMDGIFTQEQLVDGVAAPLPPAPTENDLLANLRAKHGGVNATA
jgi:hypothetical protein